MKTRIESLRPDQWEVFKAVRIRALEDTPNAFGSTLEKEIEYSESDWRGRLERTDCKTFIALSEEEMPMGIVVGMQQDNRAGLAAMWVAPDRRKKGVGSALVDAVVNWAEKNEFEEILLDVADENLTAIRLYGSKGFTETGIKGTLPHPREHITEHQRSLRLRKSDQGGVINSESLRSSA
jgi:ribosomal protein S18 acetylase RimI-like enzyme